MDDSLPANANWTFRPSAARFGATTSTGIVSYWRSFTAWELVLLGLLLLCQVLIAVAAVIELPHFVSDPVANRVLLLFHSIVLLNLLVAIVYLLYGLCFEKPYDILLCAKTMGLLAVLLTVGFIYKSENSPIFSAIQLFCSYLTLPLMLALFMLLSKDMIQFRIIGTSYSIVRMYKLLCRTLALVKFEPQLNVNIVLYTFVSRMPSHHIYLALPVLSLFVLAQYLVGKISLSREIPALVNVYVAMSVLSLLWYPIEYYMLDCSGQADCDDSGRLVARSYLFLAGLAAAVRVALNVQTLHCYKNFGFGLTDRVFVNLASNECTSLLGGNSRTRLMNI